MDRSLKERTIGAVVLVAFAVLVVPVFLDGPSDDTATVTAPVTLPGQNEQPREQKTIVLERDRTLPVPAAQASGAGDSDRAVATVKNPTSETPVPVAARPAPETVKSAAAEALESGATKAPPAVAKSPAVDVAPKKPPATRPAAASTPASATGMWAVQLGSFSNRANAEKLAADLRNDGFAAFLSQHGTSSGELHRVRIGPQKDRDAAESVAAKLGKSGHKGQVVPHP